MLTKRSAATSIGSVPLAIVIVLCSAHTIFAQNADEIVRKADEKTRGTSSEGTITIQIVRPTYQRTMSLKSWSKGNQLAMMLVTQPARDKGTVFLKRGNEVWNWLPNIQRTVKLPPSMMSESWMGTDFTNDDLVKEQSIVTDYTHSILGDATLEGRTCYKILLTPKPGAAVVWGKVILWISKQEDLILRAEYYDEDGNLVNTMMGTDIKTLGGRMLPATLTMVPADKPGNKTILTYTSLKFDMPIADNFFSTTNMSKLQ